MSFTKAKQINKLLAGYVRITGFSASGTDDDITADITSILATAGFEGSPVPVQPSTDVKTQGVVVVGNNRAEIYDNNTQEKIDFSSNEIYGRITESSGTYTISYFFLDNGSETIHDFTSPTAIDIEFPYRFQLGSLPTDVFIGLTTRNVHQDIEGGGGGRTVAELLTVSATNVVSDLGFAPDPINNVTLFINGKEETQVGPTPPFTTSGKQINWSSANAGYDLETTDRVVARYTTLE